MGGYNESRNYFVMANEIFEIRKKMTLIGKELESINKLAEEIQRKGIFYTRKQLKKR